MLEWQLKNHKKLRHLHMFLKKRDAGENIPFLRNVPEVEPINAWILHGYEVLSSRRMTHEGNPQPIPVSEIAAYADYTGVFDEAEREDFLRMVCVLDGVSLDYANGVAQEQARKNRLKQATAAKKGARTRRR